MRSGTRPREKAAAVEALLRAGLTPIRLKLEDRMLRDLSAGFLRRRSEESRGRAAAVDLETDLLRFLLAEIESAHERIRVLQSRYAAFNQRIAGAVSEAERRAHILAFARQLGAGRRRLKGDARAFSRWFGADAVTDRYLKRTAALERKTALCLDRAGALAAGRIDAMPAAGRRRDAMHCVSTVGGPAAERIDAMPAAGRRRDAMPAGRRRDAMHCVSTVGGRAWRRLNLEPTVKPFLAYDGDHRLRIAAFRCLATALRRLPEPAKETGLEETTLIYVFRSAMDSRQNIWIQCEALELLAHLSPESLSRALTGRLSGRSDSEAAGPDGPQARSGPDRDDFFVRARATRILGDNIDRLPDLLGLFCEVVRDPSPHVRQTLARVLHQMPETAARRCLYLLAVADPDHQVRAAAVLRIPDLIDRIENALFLRRLLVRVLAKESDPFVLRAAMRSGVESLRVLARKTHPSVWHAAFSKALDRRHREAPDLSVRRWAAQAREQSWCESDPSRRRLKAELERRIRVIRSGKEKRIPRSVIKGWDKTDLGRVLSVICQTDYPLDVKKGMFGGLRVVRGHRFGFRLWRFLHEAVHPSPDKRQAFPHTIGRTFSGALHIPSAVLSELTPTKVPGEPLYMPSESGWRPYLPLVDQAVSALRVDPFRRRSVKIYTSEGVTEIAPPRFFFRRWWAGLRLSFGFARYARQRNWEEGGQTSPAAYVRSLRRLGFRIDFRSYPENGAPMAPDPAVARFFDPAVRDRQKGGAGDGPPQGALYPAGLVGFFEYLSGADAWGRLRDYFFSVYENSLLDLAIFAGILAILFFLRTGYAKWRIRRSRRRLPLVIGGWGTRGKSSVERLKGALINGLGHGLLSKTTGCEAMFLHAHPYGVMREMFLFRPYDKATIWEQHNLTRLADRMGADAFLWECMGLTPAYVRVLQREWMKDDAATITNTYPDHEDIQGPAGIDIPRVMTEFIPEDAVLTTTEEQMLPILQEAADARRTRLRSVGWLEAGLIPADILERFSYEEHPHNIALAAAMAEDMGVERDFAYKAMADYVVPDIGVLKVYPPAPLKTRSIEFVSGNSANERFGALGNWRRTGFDRHDLDADPGVWITTVVNNRADRIPRSKVFAGILAEDISADRHFLIGSNLSGLSGYIRESWREHMAGISLWPAGDERGSDGGPAEILKQQAVRMRVPISEEQVAARFRAMLAGQDALAGEAASIGIEELVALRHDPETLASRLAEAGLGGVATDLIRFLEGDRAMLAEYKALSDRIAAAAPPDGRDREKIEATFRETMDNWFQQKLVVIWDYHADGNAIIRRIREETPPGLYNRVMGLQNIKGTGLDFVYSFQRWERCRHACDRLRDDDPAEVEQGLRELSGFQEYNILCEEYVRETLDRVKAAPAAQTERFQAELTMIRSNLDTAMKRISRTDESSGGQGGWFMKIIDFIEALRDAGDAVRRRKIADRIYRDLANERIGHERAAMALQALNKRQKGGWLRGRVFGWRRRGG